MADEIRRNYASIANAIRRKTGETEAMTPSEMPGKIEAIPTGIQPEGNININTTTQVNVTNYATAQVVDSNLLAENIKKDVTVLGIVGTCEGGGPDTLDELMQESF